MIDPQLEGREGRLQCKLRIETPWQSSERRTQEEASASGYLIFSMGGKVCSWLQECKKGEENSGELLNKRMSDLFLFQQKKKAIKTR